MIRDPGLQAERTAMSWWRTTILSMVCAVLVARSPESLSGRYWWGIWVFVGLAILLGLLGVIRSRKILDSRRSIGHISPGYLFAVTGLVSMIGIGQAVWFITQI
ncbi:MAG: DUF202 domain-containing protein [Burkholderiaceae bacterium]